MRHLTKISSMPLRRFSSDLWSARLEAGNPLLPLNIAGSDFAIVTVSLIILGQDVQPDVYETDEHYYYPASICWKITYIPAQEWVDDVAPNEKHLSSMILPHDSTVPALLLKYVDTLWQNQ